MAASAEAVIAASDAVYIASPPASHIALGQQVLGAGKAAFLEKPLASDLAAARSFVAGAKGQRAAVNFPMALLASIAQLREWPAEHRPPPPLDATAALRRLAARLAAGRGLPGSPNAPGGFTREVVSHFLF